MGKKDIDGVFTIELMDTFDGKPLLHIGEEMKAVLYTGSGERLHRVPAYATRAEQRNSNIFSGVYHPVTKDNFSWKYERLGWSQSSSTLYLKTVMKRI